MAQYEVKHQCDKTCFDCLHHYYVGILDASDFHVKPNRCEKEHDALYIYSGAEQCKDFIEHSEY